MMSKTKEPTRTKNVMFEELPSVSYNSSVKLQLCLDAHAHYTGQISGKSYRWDRAGSIVAVDALDAPYLLEKRIKSRSCCFQSDMPVFIEID